MHNLLKRQLRINFGETGAPPELRKFVDVVDQAYQQFDADRVMLERSLDLSSQEMIELNRAEKESLLKQELEIIQGEKNRFQALAESVPAGVLRVDAVGNCEFVNQEWLKICGISTAQAQGKGWLEAIHPEERARFEELCFRGLAASPSFNIECRIKSRQGAECWAYCTAIVEPPSEHSAGGTIFCLIDLTERRNALKQIERSQRLQSIGVLAGGIAHDLNNALSPIIGGADLFSQSLTPSDRRIVEIIRASAQRGADMVRNLLTFARGVEGTKENLDVSQVLKEMVKVIHATFPKSIEIAFENVPNVASVVGNPTQLHQVFLNLAVNARDAMPEGGRLTLRIENVHLSKPVFGQFRQKVEGDYVVVSVADTGMGMPPEVQDCIFEPFFTTKGPDRGTGLGLSTVAGILKNHQGDIQVKSKPDVGTEFRVYLPVNRSGQNTGLSAEPEHRLKGAGHTLLVVDDEVWIREVVVRALRSQKFEIIEAANGIEALDKVAQLRDKIHLVLTDINMPGMSGVEFIREARRHAPFLPIVAMSGRLDTPDIGLLNKLGVQILLDKPFTMKRLAVALIQADKRFMGAAKPAAENGVTSPHPRPAINSEVASVKKTGGDSGI